MITPNDFNANLSNKIPFELSDSCREYNDALTRLNYNVANLHYSKPYSTKCRPDILIGSLVFKTSFILRWLEDEILRQYNKWGWEGSFKWIYYHHKSNDKILMLRPKNNPYKFASCLYENWSEIKERVDIINRYKKEKSFYVIECKGVIVKENYVDTLLGIDIFKPSALTKDELIKTKGYTYYDRLPNCEVLEKSEMFWFENAKTLKDVYSHLKKRSNKPRERMLKDSEHLLRSDITVEKIYELFEIEVKKHWWNLT